MLSVLLSACGHNQTSSDERTERLTAPDVINYPDSLMVQAAGELEGGSCPALSVLTVDYGVMRDQSRILSGEKVDVSR